MNTTLPVAEYSDQIVEAVNDNDLVIIEAETGAGKTTQVPQILRDAGYKVVATQPRRLAARTVAQRVAEEVGTTVGKIVGFATAEEKYESDETEILFCTDGLQLVRELAGHGTRNQVLIIDEVHEWNLNIETLVAWVKFQYTLGNTFKVVLMSATLKTKELSEFFNNAPIISVPGRLFPVTQIKAETTIANTTAKLAMDGRNVLVFVNGKAEITKVIEQLKDMNVSTIAEILPLHGELSPEEQSKVFNNSGRMVVVATNVAQTSVTIDSIDAVVDSGTENRKEVTDGVEGLAIGAEISQADCRQRMGRAGRTKPGIYVLCSDVTLDERIEFPIPEILRSRLDQLVLRLAQINLDATELEFFHQPKKSAVVVAREALKRLGAFDEKGKVTKIGVAMSRLPVDVHHARMIIEAEKRNVLSDVLTIVACLEAGSIRGKDKREFGVVKPAKWRSLTEEKESDLLAELDCYNAARRMNNNEMRENDIVPKRFHRAREIRDRLARDLMDSLFRTVDEGTKEQIVLACTSGMVDYLYRHTSGDQYSNGEVQTRQLDKNSVIKQAEWIVAIPFDLPLNLENRYGEKFEKILYLATNATKVDPAWLVEVSPQLARTESMGFNYDADLDEMVYVNALYFNDQLIKTETSPAYECEEATQALAQALVEGRVDYADREYNMGILQQFKKAARIDSTITRIPDETLINAFVERLGKVFRVVDLPSVDLKFEIDIAKFISSDVLKQVQNLEPQTVVIEDVSCGVIYEQHAGRIYAQVRIALSDFEKLSVEPRIPNAHHISTIEITNETGEVIETGSFYSVRANLRRRAVLARQDAEKQEYKVELDTLRQTCNKLTQEGMPTTQLHRLVDDVHFAILTMHSSLRGSTAGNIRQMIQKAEKEAERLTGNVAVVLLEDIIAGRLHHPDIDTNQEIVAELDSYEIRSRGFIESPSMEFLNRFYQDKLLGVTSVDEFYGTDLKLRLEDYAPADVLEEIELAPAEIELEGKKGTSKYTVSYAYAEIDGERVATGTIAVPVSIYERNRAEVGHVSKFPVLPHEICLVIEVTEGNKVLARGKESDVLKQQVKKRKGKTGNNRAEERDRSARLAALGIRVESPTAPPPWHKGKVR